MCGGGDGGVIVFMCEGVGDASVCRYAKVQFRILTFRNCILWTLCSVTAYFLH